MRVADILWFFFATVAAPHLVALDMLCSFKKWKIKVEKISAFLLHTTNFIE
jgi:hypothetical protein